MVGTSHQHVVFFLGGNVSIVGFINGCHHQHFMEVLYTIFGHHFQTRLCGYHLGLFMEIELYRVLNGY